MQNAEFPITVRADDASRHGCRAHQTFYRSRAAALEGDLTHFHYQEIVPTPVVHHPLAVQIMESPPTCTSLDCAPKFIDLVATLRGKRIPN